MRARVFCLPILLASSGGVAQEVDVPLRGWTVPAYGSSAEGAFEP